MSFDEKIQEALERKRLDDIAWEEQQAEYDKGWRKEQKEANKWLKNCSDASKFEYVRWLTGYFENGGSATHAYDYPYPSGTFKIALADVVITPLYGSSSHQIIIPANVTCTIIKLGHNGVYFMDGFSVTGGIVPIYSDIR